MGKGIIEKKLIKLPESAIKLVGRYQFADGQQGHIQRDVQIEVIKGIETLSWARVWDNQFANRVFIPIKTHELERWIANKSIKKI